VPTVSPEVAYMHSFGEAYNLYGVAYQLHHVVYGERYSSICGTSAFRVVMPNQPRSYSKSF